MLRAVLILVLFAVETLSNPTGPPAEACATMEPIGHINAGAVGSDLGFSISTSSDDVTGGSTLQITVFGNNGANFKGVFIQVRDSSETNIVGTFAQPTVAGFQRLTCLNVQNGAFGHSNANSKTSATATWQAPDMCGGTYVIKATVMVQFSSFQSGIKKQIRCTSRPMAQAQSVSSQSPAPVAPAPAFSGPFAPGPAVSGPVAPGPAFSGPFAPGPAVSGPVAPGPAVSGPIAPGPAAQAAGVVGSPVVTGSCLFSSRTIVPDKYRNSFETADLNGWYNKDTRGQQFNNYYPDFNNRPYYNYGPNQYFPYNNYNNYPYYNNGFPNYGYFPRRYKRTVPNPVPVNNPSYPPIYPNQGWPLRPSGILPPTTSAPTSRGWKRNMGPTPTADTGPNSAADGNYYAYMEADDFRPGDYATLHTDQDLRGCFCVHLKHHHNVRNTQSYFGPHRLSIQSHRSVLRTISAPSNVWRDVWVQFDTPELTMVHIHAIRGWNNLGDMAVDDVYITPGECRLQ